jgi:hypothetical protein
LTFADAVKQAGVRDSGRSRAPSDDRDRFAAERLHPVVTNRRCRPISDTRLDELVASKLSFSDEKQSGGKQRHSAARLPPVHPQQVAQHLTPKALPPNG